MKRLILLMALTAFLLSATTANAGPQTYEFWGGKWMYPPKLDGYVPSWIVGGGITYFAVSKSTDWMGANLSRGAKVAISAGLVYLYEINKDAYRNTCPIPGVSWGIDPRGADMLGDPLWATIGVAGAAVLEAAMQERRERKFRFMMTPDRSQIFLIEVNLDML